MPTLSGRTRPIEKLAAAAAKCSVQVLTDSLHCFRRTKGLTITLSNNKKASAYGKCVVADYHSTHQGMCADEYLRLKNCYLVGPYWPISK